ncbi:MAG: NUDIX domain-containing protein [Gammaproteobacteria bacterium]|nr:NUDIX domain-containing protein [Gammaproteobacteria bacterium]
MRVNCAVAVIVTDADRVLFGRRACVNGGFEWQLPGGWLNRGESPRQAARREVVEETGLQLRDMDFVGITSNLFSAQCHSISLYFEAECVDLGALVVAEKEKCRDWEWRQWEEVDNHLFLPLGLLKQTEYRPFLRRNQQTCVAN